MPSIHLNGTSFYFERHGDPHAPPLVMIHAGICDHRMWAAQVHYFAQTHTVLVYDMRGYGNTPMVKGAYAHEQDLAALLDHLEIETAILMGCSLGGKTALDFTLRYPQRVKGLILVGSAIGGYRYDGDPHPLYEQIDEAYERGDLDLTNELEVQLWVDGEERTRRHVDPAVRQRVLEMNRITLQVPEALWDGEMALEPPAIERLHQITIPTLLIIGALDIAPSHDRMRILAERLPHSQSHTIPNTAHVPNMEQPDKFNALVRAYLAAL